MFSFRKLTWPSANTALAPLPWKLKISSFGPQFELLAIQGQLGGPPNGVLLLLMPLNEMLAFGGLPMFLWGICLRIVVGLHCTWLINSATHIWGSRRFNTKDDSRNIWWVALITFGEGWHNNHHAHPTSARHGLAWYEFDISWITLKVMKRLRLAKGIRVAKIESRVPEQQAA